MPRKTMGSTKTLVSTWVVYDRDGQELYACDTLNEAIQQKRALGGVLIDRLDRDVSP